MISIDSIDVTNLVLHVLPHQDVSIPVPQPLAHATNISNTVNDHLASHSHSHESSSDLIEYYYILGFWQ